MPMKRTISIIIVLILGAICFAQEQGKVKYGPWITNLGEDEFTVLWKTEAKSLSYITVAPVENPKELKNHYQLVNGRCPSSTFHSVRVTGLKPGIRYEVKIYGREVVNDDSAYKIEFTKEKSYCEKPMTVRTLNPKAGSCRFSMVNDMHCSAGKYKALFSKVDAGELDFIALNGDIVNYVQDLDSVMKYTFNPIRKSLMSAPIVFAMGNHETRGREFDRYPDLFPTKTGKPYYSFRQGPVAFLVLDASEDKKDTHHAYFGYAHFNDYRLEEIEWLKKAVKEKSFKTAPKKVVIMHMPTIIGSKGRTTQKWITENFAPILESAGIDLMLSGHLHDLAVKAAGENGIDYPIIVNSNSTRLDFEADAKRIKIKIYSKSGDLLEQLIY